MLVGEGFALDGVAEQTRLGCNLAAVPGFTVSPVVANAYEMYQAVAEPRRTPARCRRPTRRPSSSARPRPRRRRRTTPPSPPSRRRWPRPCRPYTATGWQVPQLPVPGQLQRRGQLHPVRPEAPGLRRQDRLQRLHAGPDPLRRAPGGEPDRVQPDLGRGLRRVHGGLRQVEHRRPRQQHLRPPVLRAARGGQGRPGRRPVPRHREEVRRPHLAAG